MSWLITSLISFVIPYWYIRHHQGRNRLLFQASVMGFIMLFDLLMLLAMLPLWLLDAQVIPYLDELNLLGNISWLLFVSYVCARYAALLCFPVSFLLSRRVFHKYALFQPNRE
jgi:hypothetical protein